MVASHRCCNSFDVATGRSLPTSARREASSPAKNGFAAFQVGWLHALVGILDAIHWVHARAVSRRLLAVDGPIGKAP